MWIVEVFRDGYTYDGAGDVWGPFTSRQDATQCCIALAGSAAYGSALIRSCFDDVAQFEESPVKVARDNFSHDRAGAAAEGEGDR